MLGQHHQYDDCLIMLSAYLYTGVADDGNDRVAIIMQYYKLGSLSEYMRTPDYAELDVLARLDLALQVSG